MDITMDSSNDASNLMKSDCYFNDDSNCISSESNDKLCGDDSANRSQNCYCGNERNLNMVELQCYKCMKWFHQPCTSIQHGRVVRFLTNYIFGCKNCSSNKAETFKKTQSNFVQICLTAIANLMQKHSIDGRLAFSKDKEIIPFIDRHWDVLSNKQKPLKNTWHTTVSKTMQKDETFLCDNRDLDDLLFALRSRDLTKIAPNYENLKNSKDQNSSANANLNINSRSLRGVKNKRSNQNDIPGDNYSQNKRFRSELNMPKLPPNGYPTEHPFTKDNFKYILAEPDVNAPGRKEFEEKAEYAGKPIPGWLCRRYIPDKVLLSMGDRATYLKVSEDGKTVIGEKGYSSIRATACVSEGCWYYEVKINEAPSNSACRIGWATELAHILTPIGTDHFGYSWRSRKGTAFHNGFGKHFADEGFGAGDTLGCLIYLPKDPDRLLPPPLKDLAIIKSKGYIFYESPDEPISKALSELKTAEGSKIVYYKNGKKIGTAFDNINRGLYYPAAAIYKNMSLTFNFGPDFHHPPEDEFKDKFHSLYDTLSETTIAHTLSEIIYLVENEGKLSLDNFFNH